MGQQFGLIGLGVMGQNLVLNVERNSFSVAVYNRTPERTESFLEARTAGKQIIGASSPAELVAAIERPRPILLMVKAGAAVDAVIGELAPHLDDGDIVIDGGNSHFEDTDRRSAELAARGLRFVGMGVSGGEEGALNGPSLMPGGEASAYALLEPVLTKIAAQTDAGPCVAHLGPGGAGHFVKMVHNGIEYGLMQLIAEAYDLLHHGVGLTTSELSSLFGTWNDAELSSFLMDVASRVVDFPDDQGSGRPLSEMILDKAAQKGTGKWTVQTALEWGVPVPTITAGVDARLLSALKDERVEAARTWGEPGSAAGQERGGVPEQAGGGAQEQGSRGTDERDGKRPDSPVDRGDAIAQVRAALYAAFICAYAQGFTLLRSASNEAGFHLDLAEVARIWRGGCIIRAALLDPIRAAFLENPDLANLLLNGELRAAIAQREAEWRAAVRLAAQLRIAAPALTAALAYLDSYRRERLPANLLQAMRDAFGAHTYERTDREGSFHTDWEGDGN